MDDLGFNKIAGAVLATGLGMMILMKLPGVFMADHDGDLIAYKVGAIEVAADGEEIDLPFPQLDWVTAMDAAKGAKVFKKCTSCHNVEEGGANGTGPNLWGVVGADKAAHAGYSYSAALSGMEANWGYEELDAFLTKPSNYAPGTKMNFIGLKKAEDRAAVIEYLRQASSSPLAPPEPVVAVVEEPVIETVESIEEPAMDPTEEPIVDTTE